MVKLQEDCWFAQELGVKKLDFESLFALEVFSS